MSQGYAYGPDAARPSAVVAPAPPPVQAAQGGPGWGAGSALALPHPVPPAHRPLRGLRRCTRARIPTASWRRSSRSSRRTTACSPGKDNRAIAGLSMGGGHTVQATNNNPDAFGWIGVWSAGGQDTPEFAEALTKIKAAGVKHYWIGVGTTDFALQGSETLKKVVETGGTADVVPHGAGRALLVHLASVPERVRADSLPMRVEAGPLGTAGQRRNALPPPDRRQLHGSCPPPSKESRHRMHLSPAATKAAIRLLERPVTVARGGPIVSADY